MATPVSPARRAFDGFPAVRLVLATCLVASIFTGCGTPAETTPAPPRAAAETRRNDPLDVEATRDGRTVLEALWALEKAVRERDAKIAELEAEIRRLQRELAGPQ